MNVRRRRPDVNEPRPHHAPRLDLSRYSEQSQQLLTRDGGSLVRVTDSDVRDASLALPEGQDALFDRVLGGSWPVRCAPLAAWSSAATTTST